MKKYYFLALLPLLFIPIIPHANSWIPPTRAIAIIFVGGNNITANSWDGNATFIAGSGMTITANHANNKITFSSTGGSGSTLDTMQNIGGGQASIYAGNSTTTNFQFKTINGTSPITITNGTHSLAIACPTCSTGGVNSVNSQTGAVTIQGVSGNITTTSGGGTITINTGQNVVETGGSAQTITKQLTTNNLIATLGGQFNIGTNSFSNNGHVYTWPSNTGQVLLANGSGSSLSNIPISIGATSPIVVNASIGKIGISCPTCSVSGGNTTTNGGAASRIAFYTTATNISGDTGLLWDSSNKILKSTSDLQTSLGTSSIRFSNIFASVMNSTTARTNTIAASTGSLTTMSNDLALGSNALENSGHKITLPLNSGAVRLTNTTALVNYTTPSNPATTTSTTGVMSNLFATFTPKTTGNIFIQICGGLTSTTAGDGAAFDIRYGTSLISEGTAIGNTKVGTQQIITASTVSKFQSACSEAYVTGLSLNTKLYIQIGKFAITGGTATFQNFETYIEEK